MKGLVLSVLCLMAGLASAETITLGPAQCGIVKQCTSIPNDRGAAVSIYGAPGYPWFYVYIDGFQYYASVASGYTMDNVQAQSFVYPDPTNPAVKQFTGQVITVSGQFTTYRTCTGSGRAQHCATHWALSGGTIVR